MADRMTEAELVTSREYRIDQDIERLIAEIVASTGEGDKAEKVQQEVIRKIYSLVNDRVRLLVPGLELH